MRVTEHIHRFGLDQGLIGLVTLPPDQLLAESAALPFVMLLNSGVMHRVGPFRTSVECARSLAGRGFRVLRFDQSGLGDSRILSAGVAILDQVVADGRAAMDSLAVRYGAARFVVLGLCSGALNAHLIGISDLRVVGVGLLDGYAYPTRSYHLERFVRRLRHPAPAEFVRRIYAQTRAIWAGAPSAPKAPPTNSEAPPGSSFRGWPARAEARRGLDQMLSRGVRFLFVYTGGWSTFSHPRQFDEMFPQLRHRDQISITYFPWADHSYLAREDRRAMEDTVWAFVHGLPKGAQGDENAR